jgi:hypothetical protein
MEFKSWDRLTLRLELPTVLAGIRLQRRGMANDISMSVVTSDWCEILVLTSFGRGKLGVFVGR